MLAIRLLRVGKKNQPVFRIVVTDKRNPPKGGRFIEVVGFYNPVTKEKNLKAERIKYWLSVGAQPSDTIHNLLITEKIVEGKKFPLHKKKKSSAAKASEDKGKLTKGLAKETPMQKDEAESPKKEPAVSTEASLAPLEREKKLEDKKQEEKPKKPEKPKEQPIIEEKKTKNEPKEGPKKEETEKKPEEKPKEEKPEKKIKEKSKEPEKSEDKSKEESKEEKKEEKGSE